jgi:hypothetical protein
MNEIAPGIFHWTTMHPSIHMRVSSYYVAPAGIVIDPLEPEDGMGFFDGLDVAPQQVVLTTGLHWRHSDHFQERYGATVRVVSQGIERWGENSGREAEPFHFGDEVAPAVVAHEIGQIAPDDTALIIGHGPGAIACGGCSRRTSTRCCSPTASRSPRAAARRWSNSWPEGDV